MMREIARGVLGALLFVGLIAGLDRSVAFAGPPDICDKFNIDPEASTPFNQVSLPPAEGSCTPREKNGFPIPDANCSPGAINPTITLEILTMKGFKTACIRDEATTPAQKRKTYGWYGLIKPERNTGLSQTCELDHIVPLVLGGSDQLENLWPQCGPSGVTLNRRYFKQKDKIEMYLAREVRDGNMELADAQRRIAEDWTQFIDQVSKRAKRARKKRKQ
jgi:hypothetical protein